MPEVRDFHCPVEDCQSTWSSYPVRDWEETLEYHLQTAHTDKERLEAGRKQVIDEIVKDEESFAPHTVSGNLLEYHRWLQNNTDLFDPVMVSIVMSMAARGGDMDRNVLKLSDDELKEHVRAYLSQPTPKTADEAVAEVAELLYAWQNEGSVMTSALDLLVKMGEVIVQVPNRPES
jgi:hypothetical protein